MSEFDELNIQKKLVYKYNAISREKFYSVYQNYWNRIILEAAPKNRNSCVLDCGCGIGKTLEALLARYNNVCGIDLSPDMLKTASKYNKNAKLILGNMQNMDFKGKTFDMVICKSSLHHLMDPEKTIKK